MLEESVIETVEKGFMTKDLAICVYDDSKYFILFLIFSVGKDKYLKTEEFIDKVNQFLHKTLMDYFKRNKI